MTRIDEDSLSLHLEVALAGVAPALLGALAAPERHRRRMAPADLARHLTERLRCFAVLSEEPLATIVGQSALFPEDPRQIVG